MVNSVRTLKAEAEERNTQTKRLFNPLMEDFTVNYGSVSYTIPSQDMAEFPLEIANHVQKHLITAILNKQDRFTEKDREKVTEQTTVSL